MKRRKPLPKRKKPIKRSKLSRSRTPINQVSDRREARRGDREAAIQAVIQRDGPGCAAKHMAFADWQAGPCFGAIHGHEIIGRYAWTAGIYDKRNIVMLCNLHNGWVESNHEEAIAMGLRVRGSTPENKRAEALAESSRLRYESRKK